MNTRQTSGDFGLLSLNYNELGAENLDSLLQECLSFISSGAAKTLVMDFSQVKLIHHCEEFIPWLLALSKKLEEIERSLVLLNLPEQLQCKIETMNLSEMLGLVTGDDADELLEQL